MKKHIGITLGLLASTFVTTYALTQSTFFISGTDGLVQAQPFSSESGGTTNTFSSLSDKYLGGIKDLLYGTKNQSVSLVKSTKNTQSSSGTVTHSTVTTTTSTSGTTQTMLDLLSKYAPTATPVSIVAINILNNPNPDMRNPNGYQPNEACTIKYTNTSITKTDILSSAVSQQVGIASSTLGDWYAPAGSRLCDSTVKLSTSNDSVIIQAPVDSTANYKTFLASKSKISMSLNSVRQYTKLFGSTFYRDGTQNDWPHLKINTKMTWQPITLYSKMTLFYQGMLKFAGYKTNPITTTLATPAHAQKTYDSGKHTSHFTLGLPIQWRDPSCTFNDPNSPVCKYYGKFFWFQIELYNAQYNFIEDVHPDSLWSTDQNGTAMHIESLRSFLPYGSNTNPFKTVGATSTATGDLLPRITNAILTFEQKSKTDGIQYVPPRLWLGTRYETDQEYFAHFGISSSIVGWEMPGLAQGTFETYKYTITGTLK